VARAITHEEHASRKKRFCDADARARANDEEWNRGTLGGERLRLVF
jgi:hypothetical protein